MSVAVEAQQIALLVTQYARDREALWRKYPVESAGYYQRFTRYYTDMAGTLKQVDFKSLSSVDKADYVLLQNQIKKDLNQLKLEQSEYENIAACLSFALPLYKFIDARQRGERINSEATAKAFDDMLREIKTSREKLSKTPYSSWQQGDKASDVTLALRRGLREAFEFYNSYDPAFTWWAERPFAALDSSLTKYAAFLKTNYQNTSVKDDGSGIIGKPIGRDAIIKSLQTEFIPYTPEELIALAQKQFEWCDKEMLKASREMGFGSDWKAAMEKVKNAYVTPGEQPAMVARLAEEAIAFLEKNDLITIPPLAKETWRMGMLSPEAQKINPFFLGGEEILISYPTNTMEHREKMMSMRGNNPHFSGATVQHELIPGHHLQQFMQSRYKPYRGVFDTPFWIEGWALYWEMNLWDKGFAKSPEDRVGMLFWRMHRCARIIFSLSYHLGKMTPQQCIDFLVSRVGHEYANAEAEVRRSFTGGYGPLYQIAYMIGGLQIYELKKEIIQSGKMTEKQFHDAFLKENCIPIEMVRAILTNAELTENYTTSWKFIRN